jgi:hypothetical protein
MKGIEDAVSHKKFTFTTITKAPGGLNFFMDTGPFAAAFNDPNNFRMVSSPRAIDPKTDPDLVDTFSIRGGMFCDEMGLGKVIPTNYYFICLSSWWYWIIMILTLHCF